MALAAAPGGYRFLSPSQGVGSAATWGAEQEPREHGAAMAGRVQHGRGVCGDMVQCLGVHLWHMQVQGAVAYHGVKFLPDLKYGNRFDPGRRGKTL